jgi:signal peptidase II
VLFLIIGLVVLLLDQWTKLAVRANLVYGESRPIMDGFFNLVYVRNDGAAWNILSGHGIVLILISAGVLVALLVFRKKFLYDKLSHHILLGLMIGGIAGNLIDRIRFGWVTDFLDFQFGSYHYPSFNIADSAICIAVVSYIVLNVLEERAKKLAAGDGEGGAE